MRVLTFCSICLVQLVWFFFNYVNYSNSKWPLKGHFRIVFSQKLMRSLADFAVYSCQKKISAGNFFLQCAIEYFFASWP